MQKLFIALMIVFIIITAFVPLRAPVNNNDKVFSDSTPHRSDSAIHFKKNQHKKFIDTASEKPNKNPAPVINTPVTTNPPIQ